VTVRRARASEGSGGGAGGVGAVPRRHDDDQEAQWRRGGRGLAHATFSRYEMSFPNFPNLLGYAQIRARERIADRADQYRYR